MSIKVVNSGAGKNITLDGNEIDGNNINLILRNGGVKEMTINPDQGSIYDVHGCLLDNDTNTVLILAQDDVNYSNMVLLTINYNELKNNYSSKWKKMLTVPLVSSISKGKLFKRNNGDIISVSTDGNSSSRQDISKVSKTYDSLTRLSLGTNIQGNSWFDWFRYDEKNDLLYMYDDRKETITYNFKSNSFTKTGIVIPTGFRNGFSIARDDKIININGNYTGIYNINTNEYTKSDNNITHSQPRCFTFKNKIFCTANNGNSSVLYKELDSPASFELLGGLGGKTNVNMEAFLCYTETNNSVLVFNHEYYTSGGYSTHHHFELPFMYELEVK